MNANRAAAIRAEIAKAFRGVQLGDGISLKQAKSIDSYSAGLTTQEFAALREADVTSDWQRIPQTDIYAFEDAPHLDAAGLRYYIPAMMLALLDNYDPGSMRVIGTIQSLYPKKDHWEYHMARYKLLTSEQKRVIARFVEALPELVPLEPDDQKSVERALRNYWQEFLHGA